MERFFSSLKTERTTRKTYRARDETRADVFDYIERFYNPKRRRSTIGYLEHDWWYRGCLPAVQLSEINARGGGAMEAHRNALTVSGIHALTNVSAL